MLLITKDLFWEPTMLMKINELALITHDLYDTKAVTSRAALFRTVEKPACELHGNWPQPTGKPKFSMSSMLRSF
jgi:hypothetical protein